MISLVYNSCKTYISNPNAESPAHIWAYAGKDTTMSAYSDWKYGLITDAEYESACREEEYMDRYWSNHPEEFNDDEEGA